MCGRDLFSIMSLVIKFGRDGIESIAKKSFAEKRNWLVNEIIVKYLNT